MICLEIFAIGWALIGFRGIVLFVLKFRQLHLLRRQGEIRDGEVIQCLGKKEGQSKHGLVVSVRYKFLSPQGIELAGKQVALRNDLIGKPLPEPGTPVTVLYANDHIHCIL